jgi:hypothetical protein
MGRFDAFLASPVAGVLGSQGLVNPRELSQLLPGVRLRLQRLLKLRDTPPVPGAIPLSGPNAAASLEREDEEVRR